MHNKFFSPIFITFNDGLDSSEGPSSVERYSLSPAKNTLVPTQRDSVEGLILAKEEITHIEGLFQP